ncbi:MAG: helix-turn-helix transcriptional regulator [Gammaproteobacteria bacterium]
MPDDDPSLLAERFGANLFLLRRRAGFSQEELARYAALHRTEIGLLEHGRRLARVDTVVKLSGSLSVTPGELFTGVGWAVAGATDGRFYSSTRSAR